MEVRISMDSKIIAAIIIAVGFVVGVYVYTQNSDLNLCANSLNYNRQFAIDICIERLHPQNAR